MTVRIIECEQRSPEWYRSRAGIPTASMFAAVMSSPSGRGEMPVRRRYMLNLASEIITGEPVQHYTNAHMDRGTAMEPEAKGAYSLITDTELTPVGFVLNDGLIKGKQVGCSPDALIGDKGVLEIKTQSPHLLLDRLLDGGFPTEHTAQCQGSMWVTGREFCQLAVYWPGLPFYRRRIKRDDLYIQKIKLALEVFCEELDEAVEQIKRYGKE